MARVEGNKHLFDVIKVNMFGVKQHRVIMIEHPVPGCGHPGRVCISTEGGKVKRDLNVTEIAGIETAKGSPEDVERSVTFKFFETAGSKEARRTILFVSKRQRDTFVEEIERLNPKLVMRKKDGELTSAAEKSKAMEEAKADAARLAKSMVSKSATFNSDENVEVHLKEQEALAGEQFFAMEENDFGFQEPRVMSFSGDGAELNVIDATASGANSMDLKINRLRSVALHASDRRALQLAWHDGTMNRTINRVSVMTFGSRGARDRFSAELIKRYNSLGKAATDKDATVAAPEPIETDAKWRSALPTKVFHRFEAVMTKPKKTTVVLLVNVRRRKVYVFKTSQIANYEPGGIVPSTTAPLEILSILPHRVQLQRSAKNPLSLALGDASGTTAPTAREYSEFEFSSVGERERFAGYVSLAGSPDDALDVADVASYRGGEGVREGVPVRTAPGTVRSTYRPPAMVDVSSVWSASWPSDDVKVWVGSYNVSGTSPPSDLKTLDAWLPAPSRDPAGARDLYVVGFQELGAASNREAWGVAIGKHLSSKEDGLGSGSKTSATAAGEAAIASETQYTLVDHVYMWEMGLWVFARQPHVPDITSVSHAELPTGLAVAKAITGVQLGNKGGLGIGLRWRETSMAFVLCHLAARPDPVRLRKREADYRTITRKLKLETSMAHSGLDFVHAHDHCWFFGDVNYRIDLPFDRTVTLYKQKNYPAILAHDQLIREQGKQKVFVGFSEGRIDFAPTYRWERTVEEFSWKRGQAPSYTDRILHRSLPGQSDCVTQTGYNSPTFMFGSDHRAVNAAYNVSLRRYYSAPVSPMAFTPFPVPTFFTAQDVLTMPVPVVLLQGLKVAGLAALNAPAAVYVKLHAPWLDGQGVIVSPVAQAVGLTDKQKESLRALKVELADLSRKAAEAAKAEAKEAKAKAKAAKKEAKAKGEKEGPKVTVQGSGADASKADGDDDEGDDEDDDNDAAVEYSMLEEDAGHAAAAASATASVIEEARTDLRKKALLDLTVEYCWAPSETAIPALVPAVWDPRILRQSHVHVVFHAAAGSDGLMAAIGKGKDKEWSKDEVMGAATIPLAPLIKNAEQAIELAWSIQAEEEDAAGSDGGATGGKETKLPALYSPLQGEVVAATTGMVETTADLFARGYTPEGIPWALTAPPIAFNVDIEFAGQPTAKLTGTESLRANHDPAVAGRPGVPGSPGWSLNNVLNAIERASRETKALGPVMNRLASVHAAEVAARGELAAAEANRQASGSGGETNEEEIASIRALLAEGAAAGQKGSLTSSRDLLRQKKKVFGGDFAGGRVGQSWSAPSGGQTSDPGASVHGDSMGGSFDASAYYSAQAGMPAGLPPPPEYAPPPPEYTLPGMPTSAVAPPRKFAESGFDMQQQYSAYYSDAGAGSPGGMGLPGRAVAPPRMGAGALAAAAAADGLLPSTATPPARIRAMGAGALAAAAAADGLLPSTATPPSKSRLAGITTAPVTPTAQASEASLPAVASPPPRPGAQADSSLPASVLPPPKTTARPGVTIPVPAKKRTIPGAAGGVGMGAMAGSESSATLADVSGTSMEDGNAMSAGDAVEGMDSSMIEDESLDSEPTPSQPGMPSSALVRPPSKRSIPVPKMAMTAGSGAQAASVAVDARFAAFFEAQFANKKTAVGMMPTVALSRPKPRVPAPAQASTSLGDGSVPGILSSSYDETLLEEAEDGGESGVPTPRHSESGGAGGGLLPTTLPGIKLPPKPKLKPTIPVPAGSRPEMGSGSVRSGSIVSSVGVPSEEEMGMLGAGELTGHAAAFFDDEDEDDMYDDEEEREMQAALAAAAAKRQALAVKIKTRSEEIRNKISEAAARAKAETSEGVVKMWMPGTALEQIAKNVRSGVATGFGYSSFSSSSTALPSRGAASAVSFAGVNALMKEGGGSGAGGSGGSPGGASSAAGGAKKSWKEIQEEKRAVEAARAAAEAEVKAAKEAEIRAAKEAEKRAAAEAKARADAVARAEAEAAAQAKAEEEARQRAEAAAAAAEAAAEAAAVAAAAEAAAESAAEQPPAEGEAEESSSATDALPAEPSPATPGPAKIVPPPKAKKTIPAPAAEGVEGQGVADASPASPDAPTPATDAAAVVPALPVGIKLPPKAKKVPGPGEGTQEAVAVTTAEAPLSQEPDLAPSAPALPAGIKLPPKAKKAAPLVDSEVAVQAEAPAALEAADGAQAEPAGDVEAAASESAGQASTSTVPAGIKLPPKVKKVPAPAAPA